MTLIASWIIFGTLIGSLGTYLVYTLKGRDGNDGVLLGAAAGAVGNLVLLLPLWAYLGTQHLLGTGVAPKTAPVDLIPRAKTARPQSRILKHTGRLALYGILLLMVILYLLPVYTVVTTSLKTPQEAGKLDKVWDLPTKLNWDSYNIAFNELKQKLRNSFILTINATILSALLGSINGYVLSKWKFPGANIIFALMLFGMFIPYQSILIPLFQFMQNVHLGGRLEGLIMAHVVYGLPITTLIFRNYYAEVPTEMLEAGMIDGAGLFGIYRWIVFPLSLPGFVVVIIWQFTQIWNEFLFAITLTGEKSQPITVALALLAGGEAVNWNLPMAGAVLAALPTLIVYIVLGRYFIRGLFAGSVKG
ncbi:MAG TPA: carbohydrate ABC transporter permease [Aggregatilineaceae bacterium]|nr:carbohydrate ABC transporter permease [Aggregatilineaceae bacterium]